VRDAVRSEPVSPPNSLLYGNLQGIFRDLGNLPRRTLSQSQEIPPFFNDIPYTKEKGKFSEWQGKYSSEHGDAIQYQGSGFRGVRRQHLWPRKRRFVQGRIWGRKLPVRFQLQNE
jgi:hypothetical protein